MKKFLAVLLTLAVIASSMGTAALADAAVKTVTPLVWTGWSAGVQQGDNVSTVTNEAFHGDSGYSLKFPANVETSYTNIRNYSVKGQPAGEYTLTFYTNINRRYVNVKTEFSSGDVNYDWNWASATLQDDGWYKHTQTITVAEGKTLNAIYFEVKNEGANIGVDAYIDDMTLTNADGENVLVNGDFEGCIKENTIPDGSLPINFNLSKQLANATDERMNAVFDIVDSVSASGNNSLKVNAMDVVGFEKYLLRPTIKAGAPAGNYKLTLKVMGETNRTNSQIQVFASDTALCNNYDFRYNSPVSIDAYGWKLYEIPLNEALAAPTVIDFGFAEMPQELYIDDLSLICLDDGANYISNGSFEMYYSPNTLPANTHAKYYTMNRGGSGSTDEILETCFAVSNDMAADGKHSIVMPKLNPDANGQYYLYPSISTSAPASGEYTFSFKTNIKSGYWNWDGYAKGNFFEYSEMSVSEPDEFGWITYSVTKNVSAVPSNIHLMVSGVRSATTLRFDDFRLTVAGDDTNYIYNGSFEEIQAENTLTTGQLPASFALGMSGNGTEARAKLAFQLVDNESYTGKNSLRANALGILNNEQYRLSASVTPNLEAGNYTFSIMVKGKILNQFGANVVLEDANGELVKGNLKYASEANSSNLTITTMDFGWYKYEWKVTNAAPKRAYFEIYETPAVCYVDDFSLTKDGGDGTNLIANGGFEKIPMAENTLPVGYRLSGQGVADYSTGNYFTVVDDDAFEGDYSLKVRNASSDWANQHVALTHSFAEPAPMDGTYTLSIIAKDFATSCVKVYAFNADGEIKFQYPASLPAGEALANGWTRYSLNVTPNGAGDISSVSIMVYEPANMLLDCLSFTDASGKDYVANGSFEEYELRNYLISAIKDDNNFGYSIDVTNINNENGVPVTMIARVTDLLDADVCYITKIGKANPQKGKTETASVSFTFDELAELADQYIEFEIKIYIWNGTSLKPLMGVQQVY